MEQKKKVVVAFSGGLVLLFIGICVFYIFDFYVADNQYSCVFGGNLISVRRGVYRKGSAVASFINDTVSNDLA